jgi:spore germination protein YaaH
VLAEDFDAEESSARLVRRVGGRIYQTYYDSPQSLESKLGMSSSRGLAGIGLWTLGYDGGSGAHWDVIPKSGRAPQSGVGPEASPRA